MSARPPILADVTDEEARWLTTVGSEVAHLVGRAAAAEPSFEPERGTYLALRALELALNANTFAHASDLNEALGLLAEIYARGKAQLLDIFQAREEPTHQ